MYWYNDLYLDAILNKHPRKALHLKRNIQSRKITGDFWLVVLPSYFGTDRDPDGVSLEIIPGFNLLNKLYPTDNMYVVGLALSKDGAYGIVESIVADNFIISEKFNISDFDCSGVK